MNLRLVLFIGHLGICCQRSLTKHHLFHLWKKKALSCSVEFSVLFWKKDNVAPKLNKNEYSTYIYVYMQLCKPQLTLIKRSALRYLYFSTHPEMRAFLQGIHLPQSCCLVGLCKKHRADHEKARGYVSRLLWKTQLRCIFWMWYLCYLHALNYIQYYETGSKFCGKTYDSHDSC